MSLAITIARDQSEVAATRAVLATTIMDWARAFEVMVFWKDELEILREEAPDYWGRDPGDETK